MKKSTKLISLLLVLVMLLSIIPMAVAADTTYKIGRNTCDDATIAKGAAPAGAQLNQNLSNGTVSKKIGETGLFKRLPRYTTPDYDLLANEYIVTDNAVTLSDPEVIGDLEFSVQPGVVSGWSGTYPCIEFNYRALKAGKTDVSLKYYYKIDGLPGWYYDLVTFTVNVSTTQVQKPSKPTGAGFIKNGAAVYMCCKDLGAADNDHDAWFKYVWNVSDGYSFGDIVPNDSSVASKGTYPWVCSMTINANKYLDAYNYQLSGECGTHYLAKDMPETRTVLFYYNAADSQWQFLPGSAPIYIDITHTAPTPEVTEYTVTYTDGVDGAAFADQTYTVKENDPTPAFEGEPSREGYVFLGWEPEVAVTVTANATYTATWELETYTISYDMRKVLKTGDYKNTNPTTFTVEDLPFSICAPTLKSEWAQKFLNWRDKDGNVVTKITEPGDITLYAYYKFLVRYRVYDEDGKEVEALASLDYYDEDDFTAGKVKFRALDLPGYEIDGWYQSTKDFGNVNKRAGSFYMAKKWELVGKLSCCINVTVMVDGEIQSTEKITGKKGETLNCFDSYYKITDQLRAEGKVPTEFKTLVDGKTGVTPAFGSCANVVLAFCTEGTITAEGDNWYWDDGAGNKTDITASIDFVPFV